MVTYPLLCVVDANILIDLHAGDLLYEFFLLSLQLVAPDVIIAELQEPNGNDLVECGLQSKELSGAQVLEVFQLRTRYRQVSANDLFALVLARTLTATLLTGDRHLTQVAKRERVPTHGTLWVLDELVRLELAPSPRIARALERMLARGRRLPRAECQERL